MTAEMKQQVVTTSILLGRLGQPEDVANACLFLASHMSDWITGEVMDVNGGQYLD
jgi:3-oxoacyl-[acyl-carrier protein] reductase